MTDIIYENRKVDRMSVHVFDGRNGGLVTLTFIDEKGKQMGHVGYLREES